MITREKIKRTINASEKKKSKQCKISQNKRIATAKMLWEQEAEKVISNGQATGRIFLFGKRYPEEKSLGVSVEDIQPLIQELRKHFSANGWKFSIEDNRFLVYWWDEYPYWLSCLSRNFLITA